MATIQIKKMVVGEQATNCYLIWSEEDCSGYVVDPGDCGDIISQAIVDNGVELCGVVLTHGHFDHCLAALEVMLNFPVPLYVHPDDQFLLGRAQKTANHFLSQQTDPLPTTIAPLHDGQVLALGSDQRLTVLHTPGHTPGSCALLIKPESATIFYDQIKYSNTSFILTGDTIFEYGIEAQTHVYSQPDLLMKSLAKLEKYWDYSVILPGHGSAAPLREVCIMAPL